MPLGVGLHNRGGDRWRQQGITGGDGADRRTQIVGEASPGERTEVVVDFTAGESVRMRLAEVDLGGVAVPATMGGHDSFDVFEFRAAETLTPAPEPAWSPSEHAEEDALVEAEAAKTHRRGVTAGGGEWTEGRDLPRTKSRLPTAHAIRGLHRPDDVLHAMQKYTEGVHTCIVARWSARRVLSPGHRRLNSSR